MFDLTVLSREIIEKILKMPRTIEIVEEVYKMKTQGETEIFPLVSHEFVPGISDMDIKSGWIKGSDIFGLKVVSWFSANNKMGLPTLIGTIMVMDSKTGVPLGILDGSYITAMRTGASAAIGAKALARKDSETLLIVGSGNVGTFSTGAMLVAMENIKKVFVYGGRDETKGTKFVQGIKTVLKENFDIDAKNIIFEPVFDLEKATKQSDIIVTATPSHEPIIQKEWVKSGTHFSCIGSDMSGKEEIAPEIFGDARVFCDDIPQCINVGEIEIPIKNGVLSPKDIGGEIGDVLTGKTVGRENDNQITIFDGTGTALLDLLVSKEALAIAKENGYGETVKL